jgi:hypothetical protein
LLAGFNRPYKVAICGVDSELLGLMRLKVIGHKHDDKMFVKLVQYAERYYTQWDTKELTSSQLYEVIVATTVAAMTPDGKTMKLIEHFKNKRGLKGRVALDGLFSTGVFRNRKVLGIA